MSPLDALVRSRPTAPRARVRASLALMLAWVFGVVLAAAGPGFAEGDARAEAKALIEQAKNDLDAGLEKKDTKRIESARDALRQAKDILTKALLASDVTDEKAGLLRRDLVDLDIWLSWAEDAVGEGRGPGVGPKKKPGGPLATDLPERNEKEGFGPWLKEMRARYDAAEGGIPRGILAQRMAAEAGIHALPTLLNYFRTEENPKAREGLHDALATVGTSRVATEMEKFARRDAETQWKNALDVIYRALERPEKAESEKPWCRAVRAFHELKERKLTLRMIDRLDAMGWEGIAALGEVLYVEDFGYHDYATSLLAKKRDRRAVPPLVFKLNRFAFEAMQQMPAHKALLEMGWYAVPELIDHLDDKAAGIWISWTLRKITGETMGTDKRKWHDWWKTAQNQHPELFDDPEERPGGAAPTGPTTPEGK